MRYGIEITNLGDYTDPRVAVRLARVAEDAGWEGLFAWDHLAFAWGVPSGDPWVILSAVAASTTHLKLGIAVTPLARRHRQVVANALATLDLLSGGRVVFGVNRAGRPGASADIRGGWCYVVAGERTWHTGHARGDNGASRVRSSGVRGMSG